MEQVTNTVTQTSSNQGTALSLLRSALNVDGLSDNLFAGLLKQLAAIQDKAPQQKGNETASQTRNNGAETSQQRTLLDNGDNDDRAAVRALMQRIRDDARTSYESRQEIKRLDKNGAQKDDDVNDTANASKKTATRETDETEEPNPEKATETVTASDNPQETTASCAEEAVTAPAPGTSEDIVAEIMALLGISGEMAPETGAEEAVPQKKDETTEKTAKDPALAAQAALLMTGKPVETGKAEPKKANAEGKLGPEIEELGTPGPAAEAQTTPAPDAAANMSAPSAKTARAQRATGEKVPELLPEMNNETAAPEAGGGQPDSILSSAAKNAGNAEKTAGTPNLKSIAAEVLNMFGATPSNVQTMATNTASAGPAANGEALTATANAAPSQATANGNASQLVMGEGIKPAHSYHFASELSAARAARGGTAGLPGAVEQVAIQLHKQVKEGNEEMTVMLRPPELGRVDIKLSFSEGNKVQGTVVADNQATLDLLSKDVGSLQRALQDAGLRADPGCLQFSLRGDGQANTTGANANGNGGASSNAQNETALAAAESGESAAGEDAEIYYITPGRVNLRV